jgi:hypothetical protein
MTNGRTSPVLLSCEDSHDGQQDFVVKLNGGMDSRTSGAVREVVGSSLASLLQIKCPEPALVYISEGMANVICELEPSKAPQIRGSVGWNFATRLMRNFSIWPVDRPISALQIYSAADIFAFDALIQNPDRTFRNPNLGLEGDVIKIFDHECAFSFLYSILPSEEPWSLSGESYYLSNHVFSRALRKKSINWGSFMHNLEGLNPSFFSSMREALPSGWDTSHLQRIESHLLAVRDHAGEFELELNRRLA